MLGRVSWGVRYHGRMNRSVCVCGGGGGAVCVCVGGGSVAFAYACTAYSAANMFTSIGLSGFPQWEHTSPHKRSYIG